MDGGVDLAPIQITSASELTGGEGSYTVGCVGGGLCIRESAPGYVLVLGLEAGTLACVKPYYNYYLVNLSE